MTWKTNDSALYVVIKGIHTGLLCWVVGPELMSTIISVVDGSITKANAVPVIFCNGTPAPFGSHWLYERHLLRKVADSYATDKQAIADCKYFKEQEKQ